jgi:hypothetical protein
VSPLATIALRFMILSLVAVGGVTSVLPECIGWRWTCTTG